MSSGAGAGADGRFGGLDLNCDAAPIVEVGTEDAIVRTGGLEVRERGKNLEVGGDEKKRCISWVAGPEDKVVGNGEGSVDSALGGDNGDFIVRTVIREDGLESQVGKFLEANLGEKGSILEVDLGEKGSIDLTDLLAAGLETVEVTGQINELRDESVDDQGQGSDLDKEVVAGTAEGSLAVIAGGRGAGGERVEGSFILGKEEIVVQVGLVDRGGQVVDGKVDLEEFEAEGIKEVVVGEKINANLVVSAEEFEVVEANNLSLISKDGYGSYQEQGTGINVGGMVNDDQLGPREGEPEFKSHNAKLLEMDKDEEGRPGLVAVSAKGFQPVEASSHSMDFRDGSFCDQKVGIDFDAEDMVIDDGIGSRKMEAEVVSIGGKLSKLNNGEKESTELNIFSAEGFGPIKACSQPMDLADESDIDQILETDLDAKHMVESNEDSVSGICDGKVLELNEEKGSEELAAISTQAFEPVKASSQAADLADGSCDFHILEAGINANCTIEAFVSFSGGSCGKLLESDKVEKGSTELVDIPTGAFEHVKNSCQSVDFEDGSGDVPMAGTDIDAKSRVQIKEDSVSSSVGADVKLLELDKEGNGIAELLAVSTKMFEPVIASSPAVYLADGSGDIQMLGTDVNANGTVIISEEPVCISSFCGAKLLKQKGNSELVAISSEDFESIKGSSQCIDLRNGSGVGERQGTNLEAEAMVGINEDSISISVSSGGKLLELERKKESTELVDISTEAFELVKIRSKSIDLVDESGDDRRLETNVETLVIIRNNEDHVTISTDSCEPKVEGMVLPFFMRKEQVEVQDVLEDGKCQLVDDEHGTGKRENDVKLYGEGCMEVDMMEKGSSKLVAASAEWPEDVDARALDLGDGFVDDQAQGTDVDMKGMTQTDSSLNVSVCGGGPGSERSDGPLICREEKYEVHVDFVDGSVQVLSSQLCPGERENEVGSHGGTLFEVGMMDKEKLDLIAVSAEEFEAIEASNQIMQLGDDSYGGQKQEIVVDAGLVQDGQLCPGERDTELKSCSERFWQENKGVKGSAELVAFSTEGLEPIVASSHAMYFGEGSDGDEERGGDLAEEAMAIDGELGIKAEVQSGRNILGLEMGEKGNAEPFSVSTDGSEHVEAGTEAMRSEGEPVDSQRLVSNVDAEAMVTVDGDSLVISGVNGGPVDEILEKSLVLTKEQIHVQGDLVNESYHVVHGKLFTRKWEAEVRSYGEKPVVAGIGERENAELISASSESSDVVESSSGAMDLEDESSVDKKQEVDKDADVLGNEVSVAVSDAFEAPCDERLQAPLYLGKEQVKVLEHLRDGCCQALESENPGERENELESHDVRLLEVELGDKRKELFAISSEGFTTVEVSHQAMDLGGKSDGYEPQGIVVNAEGMVGTSDYCTVSGGSGFPMNESLEESSVLGTDYEVLQKATDGCGQVAESEVIHEKGLLVTAYGGKLLKARTEEKGDAELFAVSAEASETVEACSQAMDMKDGSDGEQILGTEVVADCKVSSNDDYLNVSGACCIPVESLERSSHLEKEHTREIGSAEMASVSDVGFYTVEARSQDTDLKDGYCSDQKQGPINCSESTAKTDGDDVAISIDGRGSEDEMLDMSSNLVKEEVDVGEETNEIGTAVDCLAKSMNTKVIEVDAIINATQIQTEYSGDQIQGFGAEKTDEREEESTCTVSAGDGGLGDECWETSCRFVENEVDVEEDNIRTMSSKKILAHPEKVGKCEAIVMTNADYTNDTYSEKFGTCEVIDSTVCGHANGTDHSELMENNMLESCMETDAIPLVAPVTCQEAEAEGMGGATKSDEEREEVKCSGSQMEKSTHDNSVNVDVIEGHPYEGEGEIVGTSDHNRSVVSSEFSAGDQNMLSKGLVYLPECVEAANDSMYHNALDETAKRHDIGTGTVDGEVLELMGAEAGLAHHSLVDSNQMEAQASSVENDHKIYDTNNTIACETLQRLDPVPITEEPGSGSHEVEGETKIAVVIGDNIGNCDATRSVMNANILTVDNMLEKGDVVFEGNDLVTSVTHEQQNVSEQQNDNQHQKEDSSSMMVSLRVEEAHATDIMEEYNSLFGINIPDASAELDNETFLPLLSERSIGCQDVQPPDVSVMEDDGLEPKRGAGEAVICCESLRDGKSEHLEDSHNQTEGCSNASTESSSSIQQASYNMSFPEKEGFSTSDLVWGKVKSHPWWPGQIFDFTGASKLALKYQKKDHFLVAYFGDKTFAWCEESRLKPFHLYFSQMEKQTSSDSFLRALHDILVEVSRRVELSMTCLCLPEETYADIEYQKVENAGVRGKTISSVVDRYEIVNSFHPNKLLDYIRDLAQFPNGGVDRLELVVAQAQLKAFYLFKGYTELPSFTNGSGLVESDFEVLSSVSKSCTEDDLDHSATLKDLFSTKSKSRVRDGAVGKLKHIAEDGRKQRNMSELMEEETTSVIVNGNVNASAEHGDELCLSSGNKRKVLGYFSNDIERIKTKKIDFSASKETKLPSPTFNNSFKVGEFISRAASKLTCGQPPRKFYGEKSDDWTINYMDIDDFLQFPFENPKLQTEMSEEYPPAKEMLSKLCLAARNPLKGYNFSYIVISFFSSFRNSQVSNISEISKTEKPRAKRGRKKKVLPDLELPDTTTPDHMKDSYWYDTVVPEKDAIPNPPKRRGRKKKKFDCESSPSQMSNSPTDCDSKFHIRSMCPNVKHIFIAERPIITVEEKIVEERTPTAMILYFNCSDSLPTDIDLIRIFSRYGPLKEEETSIETKNNSAMVVFKKRADAEMAFSSAGKFSTFGPALLSYRLRHFPAKLGVPAEPESGGASGRNLCECIPPVQLDGVDRGLSYFSQTTEDAGSTHVEIGGKGEFSNPSQGVLVQTETGNTRPIQIVTGTSDAAPGQLESRTGKEKSNQLEDIHQELHAFASRGEAKDMRPDSTPAQLGKSPESLSDKEIVVTLEAFDPVSDSARVGGRIKGSSESNVAEADVASV